MTRPIFSILLIFFASRLLFVSAQESPSLFPFEPRQLLAALPTAPAEWKILRSEGDTTVGEWLESRATRTFQAPPASAQPGSAPAPEPPLGEVEISILDTAGFAPALAVFTGFSPSKTGNVEKKFIGSLPAIIVSDENGRQYTQLLVSTRYLLELTLTNLPRQRVEDWLRGFHFEALTAASPTPTTRPREFRLVHIDELQPKNNRSYAVSTTNSRRVDAFLKTLPPSSEPASFPTP